MEKISWTDRVRNEEVLHRVKEERNILHTIKRRKVTWIGHILRGNSLLKLITEGKVEQRVEVWGRQGRRRRQLLKNENILEIERESSRPHFVENSLWKRIWNCRKTTEWKEKRL